MQLTEETKNELFKNTEKRLTDLTFEVDQIAKVFIKMEATQGELVKHGLKGDFEGLRSLLNFRLITGIINLDLCCAVLIYLKARLKYEAVYSCRQIIVIISEGYKKLYNFIVDNGEGDKKLTYRNNSFWIKDIGYIITNELPEYKSEYDSITQKLNQYLNVNFALMKTQRDFSIHYDKEPIRVYEMLNTLDVEETFNKLVPFLDILNAMYSFSTDLSNGFLRKTELAKHKNIAQIDNVINLLESGRTKQNSELIDEFKHEILSIKNSLWKGLGQ